MSPATYDRQHLLAQADRRFVDFDPGVDTVVLVDLDPASSDECLPIDVFRDFLFGVFKSVGTGAIDTFEVIAATDGDGTGAVIVKTKTFAAPADAVGDYAFIEVDAAQIREVLPAATHVGVRVELATATDECVVSAERAGPTFGPRADLTADYSA